MRRTANEWLTLEEAASALRLPPSTVQQLVERGALGAATFGDQVRIPAGSLQRHAAAAERSALKRRLRSNRSTIIAACTAGVLLAWAGVFAAGVPGPGEIVPRQIPYRGVLEQDGAPVTNSQLPMEFRLYTTEVGGTAVWFEAQTVSVLDGEFNVALGDVTPISANLFAQPSLYLSVIVAGEPLVGRQRLLTVPYAHQAARANHADRATSAAAVDSVPAGAVMFFDMPSCPSGWSEIVHARGRTLVGLHPGGSRNAWVGRALTNLENRAHAHGMSHSHTFSASSGGAISHSNDRRTRDPSGYEGTGYFVMDTSADEIIGEQHSHNVSGGTGGSQLETGATGDQLPYVQLMVCRKS